MKMLEKGMIKDLFNFPTTMFLQISQQLLLVHPQIKHQLKPLVCHKIKQQFKHLVYHKTKHQFKHPIQQLKNLFKNLFKNLVCHHSKIQSSRRKNKFITELKIQENSRMQPLHKNKLGNMNKNLLNNKEWQQTLLQSTQILAIYLKNIIILVSVKQCSEP